jgi:hypothetical protein
MIGWGLRERRKRDANSGMRNYHSTGGYKSTAAAQATAVTVKRTVARHNQLAVTLQSNAKEERCFSAALCRICTAR